MAGMGPPPKPAHQRQRQNRATTRANLPSAAESAENEVPPLPARTEDVWHPMVVEWWESVWRSPMASEYLDADMKGGLYLLAELHQLRWTAESPTSLIEAAKEIRLAEVRFGLSPIDRRRLQWEVERAETAVAKTEARRGRKGRRKKAKDPRSMLKIA